MDWLDLLSPVLLFSGSLVGYLFGKRKQAVEVEAISVSASKTAIESLLVTIDPLKAQIRDLEAEIKELKKLNKALMEENKALQEVVSDLRNFIQWADHYCYKDGEIVFEHEDHAWEWVPHSTVARSFKNTWIGGRVPLNKPYAQSQVL